MKLYYLQTEKCDERDLKEKIAEVLADALRLGGIDQRIITSFPKQVLGERRERERERERELNLAKGCAAKLAIYEKHYGTVPDNRLVTLVEIPVKEEEKICRLVLEEAVERYGFKPI